MNDMFNLEEKISAWRNQMLAAGIKTPVPLEELENHLRDEIQQQMKLGLSAQKAFETSVQKIGQPKVLKGEFKKSERTFMKQIIKISAGVIGILVGMAFIMPAVAQARHQGTMANDEVGLLLLGIVLTIAGAVVSLSTFKKRKA
jgi:hypothetical protein